MLQYNKLYQSLKKVSAEWHAGHVQWTFSWDYLKFYQDGSFIRCSSSQKKEELFWFNKDSFKGDIGSFLIIKKDKIEAKIPAAIGYVFFEGNVLENSLIIFCHNDAVNFKEWNYFEAFS